MEEEAQTISRKEIISNVWDTSELTEDGDNTCDETVPLEDPDDVGEGKEEGVKEDKESKDPIQESKDSEGLGEESCDPSWKEEGPHTPVVFPSEPSLLDHTMWSDVSTTDCDNFATQQFEMAEEIGDVPTNVPILTAGQSVPYFLVALTNPHDIAFHPNLRCFIVTETFSQKVGVYDENFQFKYWLLHKYGKWDHPTSVLCLKNGYTFILEHNRIEMFDENLKWFQFKPGHFSGLVEGKEGEVYTLACFKRFRHTLQKLVVGPNGYYKWQYGGQILLRCSHKGALPKFLAFHNNKVIITDLGLHKFYIINLDTGAQSTHGYYGHNPGQFSMPTGIITDDVGNILIADRDNKRLLVFNEQGNFVKVADVECRGRLQTIRKIEDNYYVVSRRDGGRERGQILKLKVKVKGIEAMG